MTLNDLLKIANAVYGDHEIAAYWDFDKGCVKDPPETDTLAEFIVRELKDTYDPKASVVMQLRTAEHVMDVARSQLLDVSCALGDKADALEAAKGPENKQ